MRKKVTKKTNVEKVLGDNLPDDIATIFHVYYSAFMSKGFNSEQSFELTRQIVNFYLHGK